jgi:Putative 2OG-Fe(II) oxygenase
MIKPFGPSIIKLKLPATMVSQMNAYVDNILGDEIKLGELDHGSQLAGNVSQEILLETEFMEKINWVGFVGSVCNEWLKRTNGKELKDLAIIKTWIVRQFEHEYNPVHHHAGHISGVGYLKVPKDMGGSFNKDKVRNSNGNLVFIHGSANIFSKATFTVTPEVGDFYMFPNYLQHAVYPFTGTDEERRSVSFNAVLDPDAATY